MKKNIWIINQYAGSLTLGMEYRHYYLAQEFIKKGYNVTIISGSYSHLYKTLPTIKSNYTLENIDGIEYCWIKVPHYDKPASIGRVLNMFVFFIKLFFLPKKLSAPSLIIASSPSLFVSLPAYRLAKKYKVKFIFEVRDIWPLTLQMIGNFSSKHPLIAFMSWFEKFGYKKADSVVSVLPNAIKHMVDKGLDKNKFKYIPNGFVVKSETAELVPKIKSKTIEQIEQNIKKYNSSFVVGYVGTVGQANALEYFIDTAKMLQHDNEILFLVVGDGNELQNLKNRASELTNIYFTGSIDKKDVESILELISVCYIGWHRSVLYEFGISANKIFEYMYFKKPVIHSVNSFNDPIKESGCGISVSAENPQLIVDAILKLKNTNKDELLKMGELGHQSILKNYNYSNLADSFLALI